MDIILNEGDDDYIDWQMTISAPMTAGTLVDLFTARVNRDKLMVGPSTFFGKMALYQSGNVTGVIDRHGRPKMVTLPGRAPRSRHVRSRHRAAARASKDYNHR